MNPLLPVDDNIDYEGRRKELGLTKKEVYERAGVYKKTYYKIEQGIGKHRKNTLDLVNKALNLDK